MTGAELLTNINNRLEDANNTAFTEAQKLSALNDAQKTLTGLIRNYYLSDLKVKADAKTVSSGACTFTVIGATPIRNGIYKVYDITNSRDAKFFEEENFPTGTKYSYGTAYCVSENSVLVNPSSCVSADIYYIKEPTAIANGSTECDLNSSLEIILLDLAESSLYYQDNRQSRGDKAYQRAVTVIQTLNERLDG